MSELSSPPIAPRKQNMEKWDLSQPCTFPCALLSGILIRNSLNTWVWAGSGLLLCWVPAHPAAAAWRWRCCGEKGVIFGKEHLFPCGLFGAAPLGCGNGEPEGGSGCVLCWCPKFHHSSLLAAIHAPLPFQGLLHALRKHQELKGVVVVFTLCSEWFGDFSNVFHFHGQSLEQSVLRVLCGVGQQEAFPVILWNQWGLCAGCGQ